MSDRLSLTISGATFATPAADLERLVATMHTRERARRQFLGSKLSEALEQQGGETQGAAGNDSGVHAPNVLRASGARKSAP